MISCPNKRLKDWKDLVSVIGEDEAYGVWNAYEGNVPREYYEASEENLEKEVDISDKSISFDDPNIPNLLILGTGELDSLISSNADEIFSNVDVFSDKKETDFSEVHNQLLFNNSGKTSFSGVEVLNNILSSEEIKLINGWEFYFQQAVGVLSKTGAKVSVVSKEKFLSLDDKFNRNTIMAFDGKNNTIYISKEVIKNYSPEMVLSSFIHEVSHSTSIDAYSNPKTFSERDFKELIDEAFIQYRDLSRTVKEINEDEEVEMYGYTNPLEFISEIYSNTKFRKELMKNENFFWNNFINFIRSIFNLPKSLVNNKLIESSILFEAVDSIVKTDMSNWKGSILYKDFLAKNKEAVKEDDLFVKLNTVDLKMDKIIEKFNESIKKNIEHFKHSQKLNRDSSDDVQSKISESLVSLYELRDEIKESSTANKIKSIIAFTEYTKDNLRIIDSHLASFERNDVDRAKQTLKAFENYLALFSVIKDAEALVNELRFKTDQDLISSKDLRELHEVLIHQEGRYSSLQNSMVLFKKEILSERLNNIKYFPNIEKDNYERLSKEYEASKIPENKFKWIAEKMNGRDKKLIKKQVSKAVSDLIENPAIDIFASDVLLTSAVNVSSPLISIMNQMLQEIENKRLITEREKDIEFKKLFKKLVDEKGTNNIKELYKNIYIKSKAGNYYLRTEYDPTFHEEVQLKINNIKKEFEDKIDAQWSTIKDIRKNYGTGSKKLTAAYEVLKSLRSDSKSQVEKIRKENYIYDKESKKVIGLNSKWKLPEVKLSKVEQEVLDFFKQVSDEGVEKTNGVASLVKNAADTKFYQLPKITKSTAERVWSGEANAIMSDKWKELTEAKPDDLGYAYRKIGVDDAAINNLNLYYRNGDFKSEEQSLDLMTVYRLDFKNTNSFKERKDAESDLNIMVDVVKNKDFYDQIGSDFKLKSSTGKVNLKKGLATNTFEMMSNMMESKFYTILKKDEGKIAGIDKAKISSTINGLSSTMALTLNTASAVANVLNTTTQLFIESAFKGMHLKASSVAKANSIYIGDGANILSDLTKGINESFVNQILESFNVDGSLNYSDSNFLKSDLFKKGLSADSLMSMQSSGEHWMKSILAMTILDGVKVLDKDFNFIDKNGNIVSEENAASLLDMHIKNKDGLLEISDKVVYTTNSKTVKYNDGGKEKIDMLLYKKVYDSIGNYRANDQPNIMRGWMGSLVMLYRKYLFPMGIARFRNIETVLISKQDLTDRQKKFSYALQENEEGTYVTMARFIFTSLKRNKTNLGLISNWNELTDYEKHNIKRGVIELVIIAGLLPICTMLAGAADDDDDVFYKLAYFLRRLDTELAQYINPKETFKILRSPIPSLRLIETTTSIMSQIIFHPIDSFSQDYEIGEWKGENKIKIKVEKQIPLVRDIMRNYKDMYDFQDSSWGSGL